jgi:hypothetical protein
MIYHFNRVVFFFLFFVLAGCATSPPREQHDLCAVFNHKPDWYDYAKASEEKWGVPAHILMAFVRHESAYRHNARPAFEWFLFFPLGRPSSARGYAQIQDPAWQDYKKETGGFFKSRTDMEDALDFVGWYNDKSNQLLGISKWDPKNLYLAYHEGHTGYGRGTYRNKPDLISVADSVDYTAREYGAQLRRCEDQFKCRKWYQIGLLC